MPTRPIARAPYSQRRMLRTALMPECIGKYCLQWMPQEQVDLLVEAIRAYATARTEEVTIRRMGRKFCGKEVA